MDFCSPQIMRYSRTISLTDSSYQDQFLYHLNPFGQPPPTTMNKPSYPFLRNLKLSFFLVSILAINPLSADDLDDLLAPTNSDVKLVDESAVEAWNGVVDAFRRNDLVKAKELGDAFLAGSFKTSPYQVLGVQVMLSLANSEDPSVTQDLGLTVEMKRLMAERDALRVKYANLQRVIQESEAKINKLTLNRTQAVQAGTQAYRECAAASQQIQLASAEMERMKPEIEQNKIAVGNVEVGTNENLKADTLKLLDMLIEADEIEAAFAISNVFIRVAGSDLDIAKKQQDVIRLRALMEKASNIASVIESKQKPLVETKMFWEALSIGEQSLAKVENAGNDELTRMVTKKIAIDPMAIKKNIAKAESESKALSELARIDAVKAKMQLKDFQTRYPDYPEMRAIMLAIEGERAAELKSE